MVVPAFTSNINCTGNGNLDMCIAEVRISQHTVMEPSSSISHITNPISIGTPSQGHFNVMLTLKDINLIFFSRLPLSILIGCHYCVHIDSGQYNVHEIIPSFEPAAQCLISLGPRTLNKHRANNSILFRYRSTHILFQVT